MKKSIITLFLAAVFCYAAALGTTALAFAADDFEDAGATFVSVRTDGDETQFVAEESAPYQDAAGGYILYDMSGNAALGSFGGESINVRYLKPEAYLVYEFDLADEITEAFLNVSGSNTAGNSYTVYYSAGGGEYAELGRGAAGNSLFNVTGFALTKADALSGEGNAFKIKIENASEGDMVLYKITVRAAAAAEENLSFSGNTAEAMSYAVGSAGVGMYFNGSESSGNLYFYAGTSVTFGFCFDLNEFASVSFGVTFHQAGEYTLETKAGSGEFAAYAGGQIAVGTDMIYLKITNGDTELMLTSLSAAGTAPSLAVGENGNVSIPADVTEAYFAVGTDAEKNYMFGAGANFESAFESTHEGMAVDGHQGGVSDTRPNARKLTAGQYLAYDYDFADTVASGKLVVYAQAGLTVMVSADNGESYTALTAEGIPSERGLYIFPLTENDAFAAANNKFRLVLQAAGETYLFAVSAVSDEAAAVPVSEGVSLRPRSQESMRYLVSANGLASYYSNQTDEGRGYFFTGASSIAVFKVPFASGVTKTSFYVNQCANVKIELSGDGSGYDTVINSLLGGTGEVPYNTFDASEYLGADGTVWVRVTGNEGGGFVFDMGFSGAPADETAGTVDMENFGKYVESVSNDGNAQGQLLRIGGGNLGAEGLVWKLTGDVVFKIDLADDAIGVEITVQGIAEASASVYVSADGETYAMAGTADGGAKTFLDYSALENNASNVIYVKFSSAEYYFKGFSFNTEGIEPKGDSSKPYEDGDVDFNYGDGGSGESENSGGDNENSGAESKSGCGGAVIGCGFCAAVALTAAAIALFKKRSATR